MQFRPSRSRPVRARQAPVRRQSGPEQIAVLQEPALSDHAPDTKAGGWKDSLAAWKLSPSPEDLGAAAVALSFFLCGALICALMMGATLSVEPHNLANLNLWFESDAWRVFQNLTDRYSDHYRTSVHPLASLLLSTPTIALMKLGLSADTATQVIMALGAGSLASLTFILLRRLHGRILDAAVFTALLLSSAAFIFGTSITENYSWGGASIIVALIAICLREPYLGPGLIGANVLSLSFTATNWMAGLTALLVRVPLRRAVFYALVALGLVAGLSALQTLIYPTAGRFLSLHEETQYMEFAWASRLPEVTRTFFVGAVSMLWFDKALDSAGNLFVTAQHAAFRGTPAGVVATALWLGLLALGAWQAARGGARDPLGRRVGWTVLTLAAAQYLMHLIYGSETLLYGLHYVPLLIVVASFAVRSRVRPLVLGLTVALSATLAFANLSQHDKALRLAENVLRSTERPPYRPRDKVLQEMALRPQDPWPRGEGHMPIGLPGLPEEAKAYVEPGGAFSPGVGSFGLSVWQRQSDGGRVTSDSLPIEQTNQSFLTSGPGVGLRSDTPLYSQTWRQSRPDRWTMELTPRSRGLELVLRSVGPAGRRINTVERSGEALIINDRWRLTDLSGLRLVDLGSEGEPGWKDARRLPDYYRSGSGWVVARFEVTAPIARLSVVDERPEAAFSDLMTNGAGSGLTLSGVDPRFASALEAQVAQMLMGAVGDEARPGDPTHYPLPWQRDAAYIVSALVSAGRLDAAKILVTDVANKDYFGGFGPEADAPGLGLWAMGVVSRAADDADFDARYWPAVRRKAERIVGMTTAKTTIQADPEGPVLQKFATHPGLRFVAERPVDGLIVGRMDWHHPSMYVTAVSIRGLEEAVRFAKRHGDAEAAENWQAVRSRLLEAYRRGLRQGREADNDRTLISGLGPTFAAAGEPAFARALEADWARTRTTSGGYVGSTPWTYFEVAKARQWLMLGRPERTWQTLEWFWARSPAPGLYSLWEGDWEEHDAGRWQKTRSWVQPRGVTPHYWSAAEMLLTQTAMLAYYDLAADALVVGAGVPESWLSRPFSVSGLITEAGRTDLAWDGSRVTVTLCRPPVPVRLAGALSGRPVRVAAVTCKPVRSRSEGL